ncbi:MAG: ShlB/FhaC/HecB family hemolysin secretion/activation protein [Salinarimonas sp.]|nr:ShlB/FhaC/HecB family hemolysin secretion/activation protein [Salinarimonas sp.]
MSALGHPARAAWHCVLALSLASLSAGPAWADAALEGADEPIIIATKPVESPDAGQCFPVETIIVDGEFLIPRATIREAVTPHAADCVGMEVARAVVGAINEAHAEAGLITTQGYLPEQDIRAARSLRIDVIPGRIAAIDYREDHGIAGRGLRERFTHARDAVAESEGPWDLLGNLSALFAILDDPLDRFQIIDGARRPQAKTRSSFSATPGDVLDIEDIQQGVERINAVASGRARARLEPGEEPATSVVVIENTPEDAFRLDFGYERNATTLAGPGRTVSQRLRFDLAKDNLIGVNDSWRFTLAGGENSNEVAAGIVLPWRASRFSIDGSYTEAYQSITPFAGLFTQNSALSLRYDRQVLRDARRSLTLDTRLDIRRGDRFINDLQLTPQQFTIARVGLTRNATPGERQQFNLGFGVSRGLTLFNATRDPEVLLPDMPRAQFWKIDGSAQYVRGFENLGIWQTTLSGQFAASPLYADDQLVLGSAASVRGFAARTERVDRGGFMRNEFTLALPSKRLLGERAESWTFAADVIDATRPYAFLDLGRGENLAERRTISRIGAGIGMRFALGRSRVDASLAYPLLDEVRTPDGVNRRPAGGIPDLGLSFTFKIF